MRYTIATLVAALMTVGLASGTADAQYSYRPQVAQDDAGVVTMWYQKYLGRDPDAVGLQTWVNQLRRGAPVEASILGSDEYFARHGNTPESFVTGLYVEVLNRQPSAAEVQNWIVRLQQLNWNRTSMADEFLRAAQYELSLQGGAVTQPGYQPYYPPATTTTVVPSVSYYYSPVPAGGIYSGYGYRSSYRSQGWFRPRYRR